jgi:MYXO-CTERM domain-containing protein
MAILSVGPTSTHPSIAAAMLVAGPGDTIQLESGYSNEAADVLYSGMTVTGDASSTGIILNLAVGVSAFLAGGTAPFTWRVTEGRLPPGIASELRPETGAFRIVGTPTEKNVSNILVEVTDGAGRTTSKAFAIDIQTAKPVIEPTKPPEEGGCSCATSSAPGSDLGALALLLGVALVLTRRRR